jgi:hypothetical protein
MRNRLILLTLAAMIGLTVSCKKKETEEDTATIDEQTKQFSDDGNRYKTASDEANDDADAAVNSVVSFGRGIKTPASSLSTPCGYTIDSSLASQKILTLVFDSVTYCWNPSRIRAGKIKVQLTQGNHWGDAGSVLTITYINYRVIYFPNNQPYHIVFNGVKTYENVSGVSLDFWLGTSSLIYKERANNILVDFNNGAGNSVWNSARRITWSYSPQTTDLTFAATGDTAFNGYNTVDSWGTNRYAMDFVTYYNTALVTNTHCALWRPVQGELVHHVNNNDYILNFGVGLDGGPRTDACGYGWKITWTPQGGSQTFIVISY